MVTGFPTVSVIIGTYNQQEFVQETVESVLAQTYPHVEIILTDDGSTDATPAILGEYARRFPERIKLVLSDRNTGIPANFNRGLALRSGDFIVCLDGDDLMLPAKLERQVAFLAQHPEATGCYHDAEVFVSETGEVLGPMSLVYNGTRRLRQGRLRDWFVPRNFFLPSAILFRAAACPPHGFDERLKYLSEVVFYAEVFRTGLLIAMPDEPLVRYRRHARNVTDDPASRALMPEYELMAYAILEARYPELYPVLRKLRHSCRISQALRFYRAGQRASGQRVLWNVIREGGVIAGLGTWMGVNFLGRALTQATGGSVSARAGWLKRLARFILR